MPKISQVKETRQRNLISWWTTVREIFSFKNHADNKAGRLVPHLFSLSFKKTLYEVKASGLQLSFNIFR